MPTDGITLPVCSRCRQSRLIEQLVRQYLISNIDASEAKPENAGGNCCAAGFQFDLCRVMGWSGRAPAPPASEAGKGRQRQGARHVSDTQYRDRRDRHRYRQELVPRRGPRCAWRHRAAAKVVAWPSGSAARQYTALPDRHGSLRRCTSPEPQTRIAWSRCPVAAKYVRPYSKGQKNDFNDAEAIAEAVQRPTMKFVATKTAEQLDLQALHRVRLA